MVALWRSVLIGLLAVCLLEAGSWAALLVVERERPELFGRLAALEEGLRGELTMERIGRYRQGAYDPVTGWRPPAGSSRSYHNSAGTKWTVNYDERGAGHNPWAHHRVLMATFGDSFTQCAEVDDDETWQFFLSELTRSDVENFGVGAYGTDQALLRA